MTRPMIDYDIMVCEDCAMLIANGETPDNNPAHDLSSDWNRYNLHLNCDDDGCEGFYKTPCDGCKSRLHGSRHPAVAWRFAT